MDLTGRITGMITNPKETVQDISKNPYIEEAVLIVGIFAIFSALSGYLSQNLVIYEFVGVDQGNLGNSGSSVLGIFTAFIGVIIIWIIATGVVHIVSVALGGEGTFKQMLIIYSYAYIPLLIGTVISLILISFMKPINLTFDFSTYDLSTASSFINLIIDIMSTTTKTLMSNPYYQAMYIITSMLKLWSIGMVILGVKYIHNLNTNRALIAVIIPLSFFVIMNVITLYFTFIYKI